MTHGTDQDPALETLLSIAKDSAPTLDLSLLEKVYLLQKAHQYDSENEREGCLKALERILEEHITGNDGVGQ